MIRLLTDSGTRRCERQRFPAEIISYAVWLCQTFPLSLRHVGDLLAEGDIAVACKPSGSGLPNLVANWAAHIRRGLRGCFADKWHPDQMLVSVERKKSWASVIPPKKGRQLPLQGYPRPSP